MGIEFCVMADFDILVIYYDGDVTEGRKGATAFEPR